MKKIIKKWWVLLSLIVLVIGIILITTNRTTGVGSAGISSSEFEEIEFGMSNFTVNKIIDKNNEWENDEIYSKCCEELSKSNKEHIYQYVYKYYGEDGGYAIITYEADYSEGDLFVLPEVTRKEQFNLK